MGRRKKYLSKGELAEARRKTQAAYYERHKKVQTENVLDDSDRKEGPEPKVVVTVEVGERRWRFGDPPLIGKGEMVDNTGEWDQRSQADMRRAGVPMNEVSKARERKALKGTEPRKEDPVQKEVSAEEERLLGKIATLLEKREPDKVWAKGLKEAGVVVPGFESGA